MVNVRTPSSAKNPSKATDLGKHSLRRAPTGTRGLVVLPPYRSSGASALARIPNSGSPSVEPPLSRHLHPPQCGVGNAADGVSSWFIKPSIEPGHLNSDLARYELQSVWVIEATSRQVVTGTSMPSAEGLR